MTRMEKREVTFSFPDQDTVRKFIRAVESERTRGVDAFLDAKGTRVKVKVFGPHAAVDAYIRRLGELRKTVLTESEDEKRVRLHLSTVCREAGAPKVPSELLAQVLERRGYRAEARGPWLTTDAPMREIKAIVRELAELYKEARFYAASEPVRRLLTLVCHEHGLDPMDLAYAALDRGVLREGEDGRCELKRDPERTLKELEKLASELKREGRERGRTLEELLEFEERL